MKALGKRHIVITGARGSGKSTLIRKLSKGMPGIVSRAVPGKEVLLSETWTGKNAVIGRFDPSIQTAENRMVRDEDGFSKLYYPALERLAKVDPEWVAIDEIGYLEADDPKFQAAMEKLLENKRVILAVRKQEEPFLRALMQRKDALLVDLDDPFGDQGCVIMASGFSKRFGENKLLADFCGQTLIGRAIDQVKGLIPSIAAVTRYEAVADLCGKNGVRYVLHDFPDRNDTVRLGLEALPGNIDGCLFLPADQPLLSDETVMTLLLCAKNEGKGILRPKADDQPGAPVWFAKDYFDELKKLQKGEGGGAVIRRHRDAVRFAVAKREELADADTPEALKRLADLGKKE